MAKFETDVSELHYIPLEILRAALTHARKNREAQTHVVPLKEFFLLAGLGDEVDIMSFKGLITDVMRVTTYSLDYDDEPDVLRAWSVFGSMRVTQTEIEFSVCQFSLDASELI